MRFGITSFAALLLFPTLILAGEETLADDEKDQFVALLEEQTAIATRTRMNADYVPGMVTVLHGDDLEARGARTVWESLALVPGMETAMEKTGRRRVLVRGLGNTWGSGNIKILLNDVSMNSAELGLAEPIFNIPVEQVDRIEVIRGPGSAIYGEYAYMGVINVITRSDHSRAYTFGGSFDTKGVGGTLALSSPEDPLQASINVSGWRSSGADVRTGNDFLYAYGMGSISNAPGRANQEIDAATGVFKLAYERFSLTAQSSQDGLGDHFGINYYLPPDHNHVVERTRHRAIEARQELTLAKDLLAGIQFGWKDVNRTRDNLFILPAPDIYLDSHYREHTDSLSTDLTYRGWARHRVLWAISASRTRVDENWLSFSQPIGSAITIEPGTTRNISAVTLQDEFRQSDLFTLTAGMRYDDYSDIGNRSSPRLAGVWRLDERHIVKAQYAEAFRPPTLYEKAAEQFWGRPTITPASAKTSEIGYVVLGDRSETRFTVFHTRLDDLVVLVASQPIVFTYGSEGATSMGAEFEQSWRASHQLQFGGNASYVDTRENKTGLPFPGTARWIANADAAYERGDFTGSIQLHYVSGFTRETGDRRPSQNGYTTVDLTATFSRVVLQQMRLRIGVKNLFDEHRAYPAQVAIVGAGEISPTYPEDYPREGRSWWAQASYGL